MQGLHLTADLHGCTGALPAMTDVDTLRALCLQAVACAGLQAVNTLFHRFAPAGNTEQPTGITGVVLLAESHLAVHTWPELQAVTLDVYVCNFSADHADAAQALMDTLIAHFQPRNVERHRLQRGALAPQPMSAA
ncbi:adenosylmethionine decarboxylase [Ideonella sp. BN130291]|uniref:adenosylmethionine decarboxylase n=1 Tax=Ideonella sp. BN130291 TaxID=3112940 RepID=UPI002E26184F|nr:adenosylmethionine decarboxylase [Ideonella sp. BN130291]